MIEATPRARAVRVGVRLELLTVAWMLVEAALALAAGIAAQSVLADCFRGRQLDRAAEWDHASLAASN